MLNDIAAVAPIGDLDTLRLLSDRTRHAIVQAVTPAPLTAKEIADHLRMPQTRVYYHLKLLESSGVVRVVSERRVAGTIERSYRAAARWFRVDRNLLAADESLIADVQATILDQTAAEYRETARLRDAASATGTLVTRALLRISGDRLCELRAEIVALVERAEESSDCDGLDVTLTVALFDTPKE